MLEPWNHEELTNIYPTNLNINLTTRCNYRCTYCSFNSPLMIKTRKKKHGIRRFDLALDDLAGQIQIIRRAYENRHLPHVTLTGMGEPFMNPDIMPIIRFLAGENTTFGIISNYSSIVSPHIHEMIDLGIRHIDTNLDGSDSKTYENMRRGSNFMVTMDNIEKTCNLIDQKKASTIFQVHYIATPKNCHGLQNFIDLMYNAGVKLVRIKFFARYEYEGDDSLVFHRLKRQIPLFKRLTELKQYALKKGITLRYPLFCDILSGNNGASLEKTGDNLICKTPFTHLQLNFGPFNYKEEDLNGNVQLGCPIRLQKGFYTFGNIWRNDFHAIINHPSRITLMNSLVRKEFFKTCQECEHFYLQTFQLIEDRFGVTT